MNYFTKVIYVFAIILLTSLTGYSTPNVKNVIKSSSTQNTLNQSSYFTGTITYIRVFKNGIWWVYVYDGVKLIDTFPE